MTFKAEAAVQQVSFAYIDPSYWLILLVLGLQCPLALPEGSPSDEDPVKSVETSGLDGKENTANGKADFAGII